MQYDSARLGSLVSLRLLTTGFSFRLLRNSVKPLPTHKWSQPIVYTWPFGDTGPWVRALFSKLSFLLVASLIMC